MHVDLGGYHVGDLEFVAAFDVDAAKVGQDLGKAIFAGQNNTIRFADVRRPRRGGPARPDPRRPRQVLPGDDRGVAGRAGGRGRGPGATGADVLVSYLPVGSEEAQKLLCPGGLDAKVGLRQRHTGVHRQRPGVGRRSSATPACRSSVTTSRARSGSTIAHRVLARLFEDRGLALDRTYQLNFGGNMDFKNMLERERLESKKISKTQAVTSQIEHRRSARDDVHIGPSDHVAVARRPEVGLHPPGGPELRRRAPEPRAEARGVGLPQFGRGDDRRRAVRQAGARPGHRRPAARPLGVLHEVAAGAVPRRRGSRDGGGVRRRRPGPVWPED